jgi:hypothetical protein
MTVSAELPTHRRGAHQRRLSSNECRAWVSSHREGRLGYLSGRGPRSVVVSYAVAGDSVVVELPDYNDAAHYAPGTRVHLDVEGPAVTRRDAVRVTGTAVLADQTQAASVAAERPREWPADIRTSLICLALREVEGVEEGLT